MPRKRREVKPVDTSWEIPDALWEGTIEPLLNDFYPPAETGRPRVDLRRVLNGIIYVMRSGYSGTGCRANSAPTAQCIAGSSASARMEFPRTAWFA